LALFSLHLFGYFCLHLVLLLVIHGAAFFFSIFFRSRMPSLPLPDYLERLSVNGDAAQRSHAQAVLALMDTSQGVEALAARCVPVPLVQIHGQWRLDAAVDERPILAVLEHDQALIDSENPSALRPAMALRRFLDTTATTLSWDNPALPMMMVADACWLLFYRKDLFQVAETDPVAWFYEQLLTRHERVATQEQMDLDAGCTPEFLN
jgi:hypothetical protein